MITANIFKKNIRGQSKTYFLPLSIGHLHAYFSPACQGPGTGGCMWTLVTLLLLPSFVSLSPCPSFLSSPCQPSPLSLLVNPPYPLLPLGSQFSPQTTPLPLILPLLGSVFQPPWNPLKLLYLCFPQKISPLTLFLPIFVPPGPLPPQRWWDLGGTRCLA